MTDFLVLKKLVHSQLPAASPVIPFQPAFRRSFLTRRSPRPRAITVSARQETNKGKSERRATVPKDDQSALERKGKATKGKYSPYPAVDQRTQKLPVPDASQSLRAASHQAQKHTGQVRVPSTSKARQGTHGTACTSRWC